MAGRPARRSGACRPVGLLPGVIMSAENHHHPAAVSPVERRVAALEELLTERGLVPDGFIEEITRRYESEIGPLNGAKVVARAWADPAYRERLLTDGTAAIAELGFGGAEGDHMVVVENTPAIHNVVVCTLCSCYPWPVLGLPPAWYKDPPYRARMVREPRALLAEMGCELPGNAEIRVWDSSAEVRYLVLPERPSVTEEMTEAELDLPRRNGEVAFDAPWQSTIFALAAAVVDHAFGGDREPFRQQLIKAVAAEPDRPYWESWTAALEALVESLPEQRNR